MANHNTCEDLEASQDASQPAGQLACDEEEFDMAHCDNIIGVNDKELKQKVLPDVGKDLAEERFDEPEKMHNPRVGIVTAKEDLRDALEDPKVPNAGGEEVPESTKNKGQV